MLPRVFFCFDYERDYARALHIRDALDYPPDHVGGFFSEKEAQEIEQLGDGGLKSVLRDHMRSSDVTIVLIGSHTAKVRWIRYAIERSVKRRNGFAGLFIHTVPDEQGETTTPGRKPPVPWETEFIAYTWDENVDRFLRTVESAAKRAEIVRRQHKKSRRK